MHFISTSTQTRSGVSSRSFHLTLLSRVCVPTITWEGMPADCRLPGHYRALEWQEKAQGYTLEPDLGIVVEVEVRGMCGFVGQIHLHNHCL
jgi:hypothetical protein